MSNSVYLSQLTGLLRGSTVPMLRNAITLQTVGCGLIYGEYVVHWTGQLSQHPLIPDNRSPLFRVQLTDESYSTPSYFHRETSHQKLLVLVAVFVKPHIFTSRIQ